MDVLHTAEFDSPIGPLRVASSERGLAYIQLPHQSGRGFDGWRTRHALDARVEPGFEPNRPYVAQILEFLDGKRREFELPLDLRGTDFQLAVYEQVERIPFGESRSYAQVAAAIGRPRATRAVGAANGANPIPLIVPCHRVIGSRGQLQGYGGGLDLKARLLAMERADIEQTRPPAPGQGRLL
jgi:O-6-methylguanine DNA methyltransferase